MPRVAFCFALALSLASPVAAATGKIANFDPPGSVYTLPTGINVSGTVVGTYQTADLVYHGFLRDSYGNITTFDAPWTIYGTVPEGINDQGQSAGVTFGFEPTLGFIRDAAGEYTQVGVVNAADTYPWSINSTGETAGILHGVVGSADTGFLRDASGGYFTFGGSGNCGIVYNAYVGGAGQVAGTCQETNGTYSYFFRNTNGAFNVYSNPFGGREMFVFGISEKGIAVGWYTDANENEHGFWRTTSGTVNTLDFPGATGTFAYAINTAGTIVGAYLDSTGVSHGFTRDSSGNFTSFDDASAGTRGGQGTFPQAISRSGQIAGFYIGAKGQRHGFIRK